jgi:hypothetical protein
VGEQRQEARHQRLTGKLLFKPEGRRPSAHHLSSGDGTIEEKALHDDPLEQEHGGREVTNATNYLKN